MRTMSVTTHVRNEYWETELGHRGVSKNRKSKLGKWKLSQKPKTKKYTKMKVQIKIGV